MAAPRVPGTDPDVVELPCGESTDPGRFDLGMRDLACTCGARHAVVMDVHPPSRFFPPDVVDVLRQTIEPAEGGEFGTRHLMGMALEEFPEAVVGTDVSQDGQLGCQYLWVWTFDSRRLHEILVELVLEVMEHAMTHTEDDDARSAFADRLASFDVATFVERYRSQRDLDWPA
ncbi:MAG: DUF5815 family protein [Halobacteriales archaeon]